MTRWTMLSIPALALSGLVACGGPAAEDAPLTSVPATDAAPAPVAAVVDPELEQLKSMVPVDACTWLSAEKLAAAYPGLAFAVAQKVEPRMSGYVWDSRCTYYAGVGTIEFAKDAPTHTVEIFVATPVSEAKALANLASRRESAASSTGFEPQPSLGENAYSTTSTGVASLYLVKGGSEVQINVSDLETPSAGKVQKAVALAGSL